MHDATSAARFQNDVRDPISQRVSPSSSPEEECGPRREDRLSVMTAMESRYGWSIASTAGSSPSEGRTGMSAR